MHLNEYFEYLLSDSNYIGEEMFVMWNFKKYELVFNYDLNEMHLYNKMHVKYKKMVEWIIGGLKQK
jgi:hypothetical protein